MTLLQPTAAWSSTYESTASAIAYVVDTEPALFSGDTDKSETAALLVAVSWYESRFNPRALGDGGRSWGLFQMRGGGPRYFDPVIAARGALRAMRTSLDACSDQLPADRLAAYASGSCARGRRESRARMQLASKLVMASSLTW
ncbi:hypothetical protein LZC95_07975 [Pendulispora brunnea]|uniref:Transglycosylase SLT domain-containing protein n=1 Tax=Pendulispora brunnea TaxID=2905690 RepID=A0ABZ2KGU9_9BACT